jgi:multiple sugar transport system substrate-binding protein
MVAAKTQRIQEVEKFLQFIARPENQSSMARAMEMIPTNQHSDVGTNENIVQGADMLKRADGVTQFFDRDSNSEFAVPAMAILAEFASARLGINETQKALDKLAKQYLVE